ncbi:acyltransferase [Ktedonosporobacter rubrisoli]|uniref:Acyltransferase n=1 Tax=Ktedonosporobacter rubrisoli TaxID=2509675 RepID=A0A4P6K1H1_KTERU|nr:acyltransferase [Ktedonosporobacter rubrisoli]QBD81672.1 acyltransferase [Ktedonosporobacter rubrisoli]
MSILKNTTQKNTIAVLDGVRAFACLSVLFYHINYLAWHAHVFTSNVGPLTFSVAMVGWSGVTLFFVLSGFLLFMPYARAILFDAPWPSMRVFYLRRMLRIIPGYYVSLFLLILLLNPQYLQPAHWGHVGLFLTFLMDSFHETYQQINGPFWTLAVEWQFYMLLPFLALAFRFIARRGTRRKRLFLLLGCLGGLIIWGLLTRYWGRSFELHPDQPRLLPQPLHDAAMIVLYGVSGKYLEDFAVGMLVCVGFILSQHPATRQRITATLGRYSPWLWRIGVLWLFFLTIWNNFPFAPLLDPFIGAHNWLVELAFASGFGLCITAILFGPTELKKPFAWGPARWIGLISYSLYIWHLPILVSFTNYIVPLLQGWQHSWIYGLYFLCAALVVIPFSYLFFRYVEMPGINLANKTRRKQVVVEKQAA